MCLCVIGIEFDRSLECGNRAAKVTQFMQDVPQVGVCHRILRIDFDGSLVRGHCAVEVALFLQGVPEVVVGQGELGIESNRSLVCDHRARTILQSIIQGGTQVEPHSRILRPQGAGRFICTDLLSRLAALVP